MRIGGGVSKGGMYILYCTGMQGGKSGESLAIDSLIEDRDVKDKCLIVNVIIAFFTC